MKSNFKVSITAGLVLLGLMACNQQVTPDAVAKDVKLDDDASRLGYSIGAQIGSGMRSQNLQEDVTLEGLIAGIQDAFDGKELKLTDEEMQQAQINYQQNLQAKAQATAAKNLSDGEAFMAENAKAKGVQATDSGLQYEVLREGKGDKPGATDSVQVHYTGTLTDGTKFDSSYDRGAPATFPVGGVIPGFSEGLQLMQEGAKYRFTIPAGQAYGVDAPPSIGPNQVLVFEVELIDVVSKSDDAPAEKKEG